MVRRPAKERSTISSAFFWSNCSCARSTSVSTSPMPRIRDAIRSGANGSRSETFSPTPMYMIGLPMVSRMDSAAPPRASPSSLVRMTPSTPTASSNPLATFTASWPVMASTARMHLVNGRRLADVAQLIEQRLVDLQPAGGVDDDHVAVEPGRLRDAARGELRNLGLPIRDGHRDLVVQPQLLELLHRRRPRDVGCDQHRPVAVAPDGQAELGGGGGLARALEPDQHDHRRADAAGSGSCAAHRRAGRPARR